MTLELQREESIMLIGTSLSKPHTSKTALRMYIHNQHLSEQSLPTNQGVISFSFTTVFSRSILLY